MVAVQHHIATEVLLGIERSVRENLKATVTPHPPLISVIAGLGHDQCVRCVVAVRSNHRNEAVRVGVLEWSTARGLLVMRW